MVTTDTGAKKISNNENWRNIFDAHNDSVDAYDDHITKLDSGLAYVAVKSGNDWMLPSGKNASSGDYVIVNNVFGHATATLTGGSTAIVENTNWVAESAGALNSLNNNITKLGSYIECGLSEVNGSATIPYTGTHSSNATAIICTPYNTSSGIIATVTGRSSTGFTVVTVNDQGSSVNGYINWLAIWK